LTKVLVLVLVDEKNTGSL